MNLIIEGKKMQFTLNVIKLNSSVFGFSLSQTTMNAILNQEI
jgi:hypothetical protein